MPGPIAAPPWHALGVPEVLSRLDTNAATGLADAEAARRLARYGPNAPAERTGRSPWGILRDQLASAMVALLAVAAAISAALGDAADAVAILAILVLNTLIGFSQERRAERAIAALRAMAAPTVRILRDGSLREISGREIVPGDIVVIAAGQIVPADCRVIESVNLGIQEAVLTGEPGAVDKSPDPVSRAASIPDRRSMAFLGTTVAAGRGKAVAVATGAGTELGKIAEMLRTVAPVPTPLQRHLRRLSRILALAASGIVAVVFVVGLLRGEEFRPMFLTAVSLAVAAVPEGLPAVVTIALALGSQRMLRRNALIRNLPAVETLGGVTVICSDKTGTLTGNRMSVASIRGAGWRIDAQPAGATEPPGSGASGPISPPHGPGLTLLLLGGALCSDAAAGPEPGLFLGDPTEVALVGAASRIGLRKADLEEIFPRAWEVPFDPERKRMTTVHRLPPSPPRIPGDPADLRCLSRDAAGTELVAFTKGAVDRLLAISSRVWVNGRIEPLGDEWRDRIAGDHESIAGTGMRVLGLAFRPMPSDVFSRDAGSLERDMVYIGLVAFRDPPRPEARGAVQRCREAGIRPVMITGDHPLTAREIARELGIAVSGGVLTGDDLDRMSDAELAEAVGEAAVYARVSPEHKLRIVSALQAGGHVVAMTGDGVNDAPALKRAAIGVAMGASGTDVAREASDMVLLDDNFATIVAAVEEGRRAYDNIRRFIRYVLASNVGELWVMLAAPLLRMPLPLLPLQILWINLVTDGLPALALGVEPAEPGAMRRPPRPPGDAILGRRMGRDILAVGFLLGTASLLLGFGAWAAGRPGWQTMLFTTLTLSQVGYAFSARSETEPLPRIGLLTNPALLWTAALTLGLQAAVIYLPPFQRVLRTVPLSPGEVGASFLASAAVFLMAELLKRRRNQIPR